jgi:hypothetical protein
MYESGTGVAFELFNCSDMELYKYTWSGQKDLNVARNIFRSNAFRGWSGMLLANKC